MYDEIRNLRFDFDDEEWENVSDEAKDFIKYIFTKDPKKRHDCGTRVTVMFI